jgi:hypothetical protein
MNSWNEEKKGKGAKGEEGEKMLVLRTLTVHFKS